MIRGLDHVVVLVEDLDAAGATYQTLFGCAPAWRADGEGVASTMFTFGNVSLELMSASGTGAAADRVRAALDADGEGLASLCFRVDRLDTMHRRLSRLALKPDAISDGGSFDIATGASLNWRRTRAATQAAHGVRLFFLEMERERPRSATVAHAPIVGLDHVVVATQNPERAAALYGARLGLDMALDRSHPDWGRLMFFRCGDLVVEVVQRPGQGAAEAPDKLWGVSWRVTDLDATRARLVAAGVDVSAIRTGRKPGTRVMSLRSGTTGIPTLLLERSPRPDDQSP